jgi:hypothetical protein
VQVRAESPGHFAVWLLAGGRWQRRNGFSTPYAEHARRTAEQWYGPPRAGGPSGTEARQSISTLTDRIHSRSQGGS